MKIEADFYGNDEVRPAINIDRASASSGELSTFRRRYGISTDGRN